MELIEHYDKVFDTIDYAGKTTGGQEFNQCTFKKCDLSNSGFLKNKFLDCTFDNCNLSMMKFGGSTLSNVVFKNCKILGVNFSECQDFLFSVTFNGCILDYASFQRKKMLKTSFMRCSLKEVTFSEAVMPGSSFNECNLMDAVFNRTDLSSVDFTTAYNYIIDPEINTMKKAKFALHGVHGLLTKYQIEII